MKLAIASENESRIAAHTGKCRGFVIYEVVRGTARRIEFRPNRCMCHSSEPVEAAVDPEAGASHVPEKLPRAEKMQGHAPLVSALCDCQALVSRGMGPRLLADLNVQGITPFLCESEDVEEAAQRFAKGELIRVGGRGECRRPAEATRA